MVRRSPAGAPLERAPDLTRQRQFRERPGVHQHVDGFDGDDDRFLSGDAEISADRKGGVAEANGHERELEHLVEPRRRLPFDRLFDELKIEIPLVELRKNTGRAQKLVDGDVDAFVIAGVENDVLWVALVVANAEVAA